MKKRIISVLLILAMLTSMLISCKKDEEPAADNAADAPAEEAPPPFYEIGVDELANYTIVFSEKATSDVQSAASTIASAFSMKFDVAIKARDDSYVEPSTGELSVSEYEILIGETNREESAQFMSELEYKDRGYKVINKKIVIGAHDLYQAAQSAMEFASYVRAFKKGSDVFFNTDMDKITLGKYSFGTMTIDGADISEYKIVYPKGKDFEKALANKLMKAIGNACGSVLPVCDDKTDAADKEILVGKTSRDTDVSAANGVTDGRGYAAVSDEKLVLCGSTALGNATAVEWLIGYFDGSQSADTLSLDIEGGLKSSPRAVGTLSAMTFNLDSDGVTKDRAAKVVETIVDALPDTVSLQECSVDWKKKLTDALGDYYTYVGIGGDVNGEGNAAAILYAKEKFTEGKSGTKWLSDTPDEVSKLDKADANYVYTYLELTPASGKKIMVINTQLGNTSAVRESQVRMLLDFMYENKDTAMLLTADMRGTPKSVEFVQLMAEFMTNCVLTTDNFSGFGIDKTKLDDTVFVYDYYVDVSLIRVYNERINGSYASPNRAMYIEYVVDYNGTKCVEKDFSDFDGLYEKPDRDGEDYPPFIPF